jgi:hypothetical protein
MRAIAALSGWLIVIDLVPGICIEQPNLADREQHDRQAIVKAVRCTPWSMPKLSYTPIKGFWIHQSLVPNKVEESTNPRRTTVAPSSRCSVEGWLESLKSGAHASVGWRIITGL